MTAATVIRVNNVSKSFRYWTDRPTSLKSALIDLLRGRITLGHMQPFSALEHVSFEIKQGEFVGIMGRNGAGKSTLLKMISGIYKPSSGSVEVNGSVAPLIELGAGFHNELSGYENIFLNAAILGFGRKATLEALPHILEFADLGDLIHMPIRNFSSGMLVRLGFSIATHLPAPILLVDEVLAVGDVAFQQKCLDIIHRLHKEGRTIVLVTHSPEAVKANCNRCIVIADKQKIFDGNVDEATEVYARTVIPEEAKAEPKPEAPLQPRPHVPSVPGSPKFPHVVQAPSPKKVAAPMPVEFQPPRFIGIIRTQGKRWDDFREALHSLTCQQHECMALVVVHGNQAVVESARKICAEFPTLKRHVLLAPDTGKKRGYPLNCALEYCYDELGDEYDFLFFLDDDDIVYPFFTAALYTSRELSGCDISYGASNKRISRKQLSHAYSPKQITELLIANFIPINSYIIGLKALRAHRLLFSEELTYFEDWHFLLQMLSKGFRFEGTEETVSEFRIHEDGSNSISQDAMGWRNAAISIRRFINSREFSVPGGMLVSSIRDVNPRFPPIATLPLGLRHKIAIAFADRVWEFIKNVRKFLGVRYG